MAEQQPSSSFDLRSNWLAWLGIAVTPFIFTPFGTDPYSNLRWTWLAALTVAGLWSVRKEWSKVIGKQQQWFMGAVFLFAMTGFAGLLVSLHPLESTIEILRWVMLGGLVLVFAFKLRQKTFQMATWQAMTVATLGLTFLWMLQKIQIVGSIPAHGDPGAATLGNLNFFAGGMVFLIPGCLLLGLRGNGTWKWIGWLATAAAIAMVILGKSAGAMLAMLILVIALAEGAFIYKLPNSAYAQKLFIRLSIWGAAVVMAIFLFWQFGGNLRQEASGLERVEMAEKTIEIIAENPILGVGANEWSYRILEKGLVSNYQGFATRYLMQTHNDFLQYFAERGIIGGLAFLMLFILPFMRVFSKPANESRSLETLIAGPAILAWATFALTSLPAFRPYLTTLLVVYLGLALSFKKSQAGPWAYILWMLLLSSICFGAFSVLRMKSDVDSFELLEAKSQQNWPKTQRLAEKHRSWYHNTDGMTGTPIAWFEGLAYLNMQQYPKAIEKLKIAQQWNPWHPQVASNLGVALYLNQNQSEGIQELEAVLIRFPDFEDVRQNLCEIYMTEGKYADVRRLIVYWESHTGNPKYDGYYRKITQLLDEYQSETLQTN